MGAFQESKLAHSLLDGLQGIEIGASAHNSFGLQTWNIDRYESMQTIYKDAERTLCGSAARIDVVAYGDCLPIADTSVDFVLNSHVIEHFYDPIRALKEWYRITRSGGYIYTVAPHQARTGSEFDDGRRPRTTVADLIARHNEPTESHPKTDYHWSVWHTQDFIDLVNWLGWPVLHVLDIDDKVGNGFTVVIGVIKP